MDYYFLPINIQTLAVKETLTYGSCIDIQYFYTWVANWLYLQFFQKLR